LQKIGKDIYICNCCGKEIILDYENMNEHEIEWEKESITNFIIHNKGYGSLFDCASFDFDVCDECLVKWFDIFKYHPYKK
jgi:hypothetical protein